jgi:signal transduction histidine kinase
LLRVAFLNVLHNALKFSPEGSTLRISYVRSQVPHASLSIAFQDEGPGIATGEHQRVFDRFFTSASQRTFSGSGTGLGLSVAKLVIDRVGGRVWFDESVSSGARCVVDLPSSLAEEVES